MEKEIVTVGTNHVCPMVTGTTPHVGGPIIGPGCPGVLIDGKPIALMGDTCTCCGGTPDTIVQGCPGILVDGVPIAVQGCMTAHGGTIPAGVSGIMVSSATPVKPLTMNIKKIPFPKIRTIDTIGAATSGNSAKLEEAKQNMEKLKEESCRQDPVVYNLRWEKENVRVYAERIDETAKIVADTANIPEGDTVKVKVTVDKDSRVVKELDATVRDGKVEIDWDASSEHFDKKDPDMGDTHVGSYKFSTDYNGITAESSTLDIIDGIRLFPMRFGIYRDDSKKDENIYPSDKFSHLDGKGNSIPVGKKYGYHLSPMILRNGWLYVYSHRTQSVYVYECTSNTFTLTKIKRIDGTSGSKDSMGKHIKRSYNYIPLLSDDRVQLFYSSIELSDTFIESTYKEKPIGSLFNCKDWRDGITKSDIERRHIDAESAWFMADNTLMPDDCVTYDYRQLLDEIRIQHEDRKTKFRDIFFLLDDPLGCIEQLVYELNEARIEHESIIRSVRMGISPEEIKGLLAQSAEKKGKEGGEKTNLLSDIDFLTTKYSDEQKQQIEQAQYIHALALYLYNFVYGKKDNHLKEKGAKVLDKDYLEKLLAKEERKKSRAKIENIRKLINEYINSPIFTRFCERFTVDTKDTASDEKDVAHAEMKFALQRIVANFIQAIVPVPHINDKGMDLPEMFSDYRDPCAPTIKSLYDAIIGQGDHKVGMLFKDIPTLAGLNLDIAMDDNEAYREKNSKKVDISVSRYFFLFDNLMNSYWRLALEAGKTRLLVSKFKIDRTELLIEYNKGDVTNYLNKLGRKRFDAKVIEGRGTIQIRVNKVDDLTKPVYIKTIAKNPNKFHKLFKRLTTSNSYLSVVSFIQLSDIISGYEKDYPTRKYISKSIEFTSNVAVIQRRFVEASLELRKATTINQTSAKIASLARVQTQMKILGAVGMFAGAADSIFDGAALLKENDKDAALLYIVSGAFLGFGGVASLLAIKFAWAGPVGMALAIAAFACAITAEILRDSDIEAFIKRTVLYKQVMKSLSGEPYQILHILSKTEMRNILFNDEFYDEGGNRHLKVLSDYRYQLEAFLYTQAMIPFFSAKIEYWQDNYLDKNRAPLYDKVFVHIE